MTISNSIPALKPTFTGIAQSPLYFGNQPLNPSIGMSDSFRATKAALKFGASYNTNFQFSPAIGQSDVLIVPVFKREAGVHFPREFESLDKDTIRTVKDVLEQESNNGASITTIPFNKPGSPKRIVILGLGDKDEITPREYNYKLRTALNSVKKLNPKTVTVTLPEKADALSRQEAIEATVAATDAVTYQTREARKSPFPLENLQIVTRKGSKDAETLRKAQAISKGEALMKELGDSPYNRLNVQKFLETAQTLADTYPNISLEVRDAAWIKENMPAFYSVAMASLKTDPPVFIMLHYKNIKPGADESKIIRKSLIGKTIVMDTGGEMSKGDHMNGMSKDMLGGAIAMGVMKTLGEYQPENTDVRAFMAVTPNYSGPGSNVPDNILDSAVGKRIEVKHTDAEGRLTLIDALTAAVKNGKLNVEGLPKDAPDEIMDFATLTGAVASFLGNTIGQFFKEKDSKAEALNAKIKKMADRLGEPLEDLKVTKYHQDLIKSTGHVQDGRVDIANISSGRKCGGHTAAAFVMEGLPDEAKGKIGFVHWDIAGVMTDGSWDSGPTSATGFKTIAHYALGDGDNK